MNVKKCPFCGGSSYSAAEHGDWKCPYCGSDLSMMSGKPAGAAGGAVSGRKKLIELVSDFKDTNMPVEEKIKSNLLYLKINKDQQ